MSRFVLVLLLSASALWAQNNTSVFSGGQGVLGQVNAVIIQPDGKVVIGGAFTAVNGAQRWNIARLNVDGTLDPSFAANSVNGLEGQVFALALQSDGGVVAGGSFIQNGKSQAQNLVRYQPDGTVDSSFGQPEGGQATNGVVRALAVQPDGKIVLGGDFSMVFSQERRGLARLNPNGTLDQLKIGDNVISGAVQAVASAPTSEVVAGGSFTVNGKEGLGLVQVKKSQAP